MEKEEKRILLTKSQLNGKEVAKLLNINYKYALILIKNIRSKNKRFYDSPLFLLNTISPMHIIEYLGLSTKDLKDFY